MASKEPTIVLSPSQDIPFNKLILSQANVRRVTAGLSIEQLAEDIARRGLLQSLNVRPVRDADGTETGAYEVPAGGRRFRALELLVKQKRMAKIQPVPCVVSETGFAAEDSLAENVQRMALHPLDQFRAFQTLREAGLGEEEIAARFFVGAQVVKQRLKLAAVSPKLLDLYAEDAMTLEQLMAFSVTDDQARQEQVWESLAHSHSQHPWQIRRQLTESAVSASDKRACFVGVAAYEAAGGDVLRDLFEQDNGGWLQDSALLDRLAIAKLTEDAEALRAEGWKWIEVAIEFPYGHGAKMRRLAGTKPEPTAEARARYDAMYEEFDRLDAEYADAEELPDEIAQRLDALQAELEAFAEAPEIYDPVDIARAGAFVSIASDGAVRVERGYVRREDEAPVEGDPGVGSVPGAPEGSSARPIIVTGGGAAEPSEDDAGEGADEGVKPLSERLVTELTAQRTLALRDALAGDPEIAFVAVLHALCLRAFYRFGAYSCLEIEARSPGFVYQPPGMAECDAARAIAARQEAWAKRLPEQPGELWDALIALDAGERAALFAHCAALTVNAVVDPNSRSMNRITHADHVARAIGLDMAASWTPTVANYLGRVTKARILEAVTEAKGEAQAQLIDHLKKPEMAKEAERLLAGTGWLPEPLRLPEPEVPADASDAEASLPAFLDGDAASADTMAAAAE